MVKLYLQTDKANKIEAPTEKCWLDSVKNICEGVQFLVKLWDAGLQLNTK